MFAQNLFKAWPFQDQLGVPNTSAKMRGRIHQTPEVSQTTIAQRLSRPALALSHEQLGGYAVVERHNLAVCRHIDVPMRLVSVRVSARPNDGIRQARLPGFASRPEAKRAHAQPAV